MDTIKFAGGRVKPLEFYFDQDEFAGDFELGFYKAVTLHYLKDYEQSQICLKSALSSLSNQKLKLNEIAVANLTNGIHYYTLLNMVKQDKSAKIEVEEAFARVKKHFDYKPDAEFTLGEYYMQKKAYGNALKHLSLIPDVKKFHARHLLGLHLIKANYEMGLLDHFAGSFGNKNAKLNAAIKHCDKLLDSNTSSDADLGNANTLNFLIKRRVFNENNLKWIIYYIPLTIGHLLLGTF